MKSVQNKDKFLSPKKDAVKRKSSVLFTQMGLVLALLLTYFVIESKTLVKDDERMRPIAKIIEDDIFIPETTHKEIPIEKPKPKPELMVIIENLKIIDDDEILETIIDPIDPDEKVEIPDVDKIPYVDIVEPEKEDVPFILIEDVPVFPGCKGNKETLKICFSKKVRKLIGKNFNPDIAQDIGLDSGTNRIFVQFVIDKNGHVSKINSNAAHKRLQNEAERVIGLLPKMIPGKQRKIPVGVKYSVPISFIVE